MSQRPLSTRYRTAFITGASTGLGKAFAQMLLAEGVEVWGTARDVVRLTAHDRFHAVSLELGDGAEAEKIFLKSEIEAGGFDIVINNAGFGAFGAFASTEFSVWESQLQMMLVNTARLSQVALRGMLQRRGGALVNISSIAAEFPLPYQATYNMTKAGLSALSESLLYETRGTGVVVIDFRPGDYRTDFEGSVLRPIGEPGPGQGRAWAAFGKLLGGGPAPAHAAKSLRQALHRGRSGTVRTGRFFQAILAPFLVRFISLSLKRRIQARYFDL